MFDIDMCGYRLLNIAGYKVLCQRIDKCHIFTSCQVKKLFARLAYSPSTFESELLVIMET
jgi:hypothetical protein